MSAVSAHPAPPDLIATDLAPAHLPEVRLVPPDAVPEGAVVLGVVVALLAGGTDRSARPIRQLVAVPAADSASPTALSAAGTTASTSTAGAAGAAHAAVPATPGGPSEDGLVPCGPGLVVDRWGRRVLRDGREVTLTRREFELLEHLVIHPGRVFTRTQLMSAVWDFADTRYVPARTVDVHVSRLRRKLGSNHASTLESLRGVGYRWAGRAEAIGGTS